MKLKQFKSEIDNLYQECGDVEVAFARDVNDSLLSERIYIWDESLKTTLNNEEIIIWIDKDLDKE